MVNHKIERGKQKAWRHGTERLAGEDGGQTSVSYRDQWNLEKAQVLIGRPQVSKHEVVKMIN